ncbi:MAG TPA: hypothetical protein VK762_36895 [Polyangiaceae bacterium]|jgi:hypothetical protein|nr:hypothetical protein [Polyangiaceae bacterium]
MRLILLPAVLATGASIAACADATHDEQVQALGGEAPGVAAGPEHRPGQPCLVCHGGEGPASSSFSVAGTVYALFKESAPAVGAQVQIEDITGAVFRAPTNAAGNFYVTTSQWQPTYPTQMQVSLMAATNQMLTHVGRDGSCATCHQSLSGPSSPGPVYVATDPEQLVGDGGTGP